MISVHQVLDVLSRGRFSVNREKDTQAEIDEFLRGELPGVTVSREHRLGPGDIPDFLIAGQIVVEIKLKGQQKRRVFDQLERYASYPEISSIILASNLSMGLPPTILGRPAFFVSLGAAWL